MYGFGGMPRPKRQATKDTRLYDLLGLDRNCSAADVKKAYRSMALKHHPDRGGDAEKVGGMLHKV